VRGSTPASGPGTARYGGRTICLSATAGNGHTLVVDCGTGMRDLQEELIDGGDGGQRFDIFLTHYHWDHLIGLPFFKPLYDERNRFTFHGHEWEHMSVEDLVGGVFRPPWFPISLADTPADKRYVPLSDGAVPVGPLAVRWAPANHPQGTTAYRIDGPSHSVVVATDHEAGDETIDAGLVELARGADVLIHDSQYTSDEYQALHRGWGHSTWAHAGDAAAAANVRELVLISHDPDHDDNDIDAIVQQARERFPATVAGYEGMRLQL
jgi:phosphoribosyl 1,2-cyclic phosphodiesterase